MSDGIGKLHNNNNMFPHVWGLIEEALACEARICGAMSERVRGRGVSRVTSFRPLPACVDIHRMNPSSSTWSDHAVDHEPDDPSPFNFSPGSASDYATGPNLNSWSVQNINHSPAATPAWTHN
ncbi:hypothetical protein EVAR_29980_1 [Eumeta japonica]|uniref:Uncharacterized protein n=1 Tax=Eumeta variegata TaxID=151549 RepID=A0A4C1VF83_EUMVA|nr:hypothetical protein EVAR_29980_1 [Eumeta japonica]